jgi:hypothetical protein
MFQTLSGHHFRRGDCIAPGEKFLTGPSRKFLLTALRQKDGRNREGHSIAPRFADQVWTHTLSSWPCITGGMIDRSAAAARGVAQTKAAIIAKRNSACAGSPLDHDTQNQQPSAPRIGY